MCDAAADPGEARAAVPRQAAGGAVDPIALEPVDEVLVTTLVLFDTGLSPTAMVTNADRLGVDLSTIQGVVLSHGHFDHAGGLAGLAGKRGVGSLPWACTSVTAGWY
ncbi:MAG TPA: MBL fold metallo-hydrolase [Pseudonocardia sp.]